MSRVQVLSEREKFLIVKYENLIDRYFRMRHSSQQEKEDYYAVAAEGLVCGVRDVDNAAERKSFTDEADRERYYVNFLLTVIRYHVITSIRSNRTWSRGGRVMHISTADTLSNSTDADETGTVEDLIADSFSLNSFKAIEDREFIKDVMKRCTVHQQTICSYIASGFKCSEIAGLMGVTAKHIYRELAKIRKNNPDVIVTTHIPRKNTENTRCISTENGKCRIQLSINGKQYRTGYVSNNEAECIRDELLLLRDKDPEAAIKRIKEIRTDREYKNPRNIRFYKNFYAVRLSIDGAEETVGMIPTPEEAVTVRDKLIEARKRGFDEFYAELKEFRKMYGGKNENVLSEIP